MKWLKIKLIHSPIGRTEDQHGTVRGLGFRKTNHERWIQDSVEVRGMLNKVPHLVKVLAESDKKPA